MMITRKNLRRLISERIKPYVPDVPDDDISTALEKREKIEDLARSKNFRSSADSMAHTYKYPDDRSYSEDLAIYDDVPNAPMREYHKQRIARDIIDLYDDDYFGFDLDKHIYTAMNTRHPDDFDDFLKEIATDAYNYTKRSMGNPFKPGLVTPPGAPSMKINDEQAIDIVHHLLKRESQLI